LRIIPIAAVLALWGIAAAAQTMTGAYSSSIPVQSATRVPVNRDAINPLSDASRIPGTAVYGSDEGKIGYVATILIDPRTRGIDRLVVTAGGFLGFGTHPVAIAVNQFSWDAYKRAFRLPATLAFLKSMPAWSEGETATGSAQPSGIKSVPTGAGR
jgi:hypothetical protein